MNKNAINRVYKLKNNPNNKIMDKKYLNFKLQILLMKINLQKN